MYYDGPPGLTLDLMPPSRNGIDLEYLHPYADVNPYRYAYNNAINDVDPSGMIGYGPGAAPPPPKCPPGCTREARERLRKMLSDVAKATKVPGIIEHCQRWEAEFETNLARAYGPLFPSGPCIKSAGVARFTFLLIAGHAAYRVAWCDGTVMYVDNGAFGGEDQIFGPSSFGFVLH